MTTHTATADLKEDHVFIRRVKAVIDRCHDLIIADAKSVPFEDIGKIADIIEQFVDRFHHHKEESSYFPETEHKTDHFSEEVRKFLIEHEFGRRIAKRIRIHLDECRGGKDSYEPLARFLKTYSIFIQDHTSKEDVFFSDVEDSKSLNDTEEGELQEKFARIKAEWRGRNQDMYEMLEHLERASWMGPGKQ